MAKIEKFIIENFKGIEYAEVSLSYRLDTPIITLVGLNESGKTTILEALSHFVTGDPVVAKIFEDEGAATPALSLIPIHKKANFTGAVKISAKVILDEDDVATFARIALEEFDLILDTASLGNTITVARQYTFLDGTLVPKESGTRWWRTLKVKTKKARDFKDYSFPSSGPNLNTQLWNTLIDGLPTISYFPTFLVDLPSRIYVTAHENETPVNRHYRYVLQDVLDSLNEGLSLETHVAQRIASFKENEESASWISLFLATPLKGQVQSVIQKISNAVSREIIGSWNKIFHRSTSAKSISLEWNIDTEKENLPYVTIQISDGESQYALHERSLGFRWFFSFLLFTRFKQSAKRGTIFLFDEPAANLHARAQTELLQSFSKIVEGGHKVIYSTHSHHMINPEWLSGAYIVENKAIDYDNDDEISKLDSRQTDIKTHSYRSFVSQYPQRVSYYQPILEKLGYINPKITPSRPVVITEGISDFHAFSVICKDELRKAKFDLVPGLGAGASGPQISFLIASNQPFMVLLDDDKPGLAEAKRYREKWFLTEDTVTSLGAIDKSLCGKKLETLLSAETHEAICKHFAKKTKIASKEEIGIFFAEKNFTGLSKTDCSTETKETVKKIISYLNGKF